MTKSFTINDLPREERPRERLVKFGEQALSAQELLQLILGRGISGESVSVTAQRLISKFGSLQKLAEASIEELSNIKGIGTAKATQIRAVIEIGRRISSQVTPYKKKELKNPENIFKIVRNKLKDHSREHFYVIALDSRNCSIHGVSLGTINASIVHPREVFTEAIKSKATSVIIAHNHPSDNTEPSKNDFDITKRLVEAGKILGIEVIDHIIVTKNNYLSFRDKGLI